MAEHEGYYVAADTVVETRPRTREEIREELQEELRLMGMDGVSAEAKRRLERAITEGAVGGEVELFERTYRKQRPESRNEIERLVDQLGLPRADPRPPTFAETVRASTVQVARPAGPASAAAPQVPGRAPSGGVASRVLSPEEKAAVTAHVGGDVVRTEARFNTRHGRVVDVTFRRGGETMHTLALIRADGRVSTSDEIGSLLDALPDPAPPDEPPLAPAGPSAEPEWEAEPEAAPEVAAAPSAPAAPAPAPAAPAPARAAAPPAPAARRKAEVEADGRTRAGLTPTVANQPVEAIEGVGEAYGVKLRAAGVEIVEDLIEADGAAIASQTGISRELVAKWQAMGQLQAVNGVGPQYSELLVRSGIRTMDDLAAQEPEALARKLNDYEESLGVRVQGTVIDPARTERWITQAMELAQRHAPAGGPGAEEAGGDAPGAEAAEDEAPAKKKGLGGLKLGGGKGKEKARPAEKPRKGGFGFGKKARSDPAPVDPEPASGAEAEAGADEGSDAEEGSEADEAPAKKKGLGGLKLGGGKPKKGGLPFGRKK